MITTENITSCRKMIASNTTHKSPKIVYQLDKYETKQKIQQNFKTYGPITLAQIATNTNQGIEYRLVFINDYFTNFTRQLYEVANKLKIKHGPKTGRSSSVKQKTPRSSEYKI